MRRQLLVIAALSGWTAAGLAQAPASKPTKSEFRVGGFMVNGDRSYQYLSNPVTTATGSTKGVEVLAPQDPRQPRDGETQVVGDGTHVGHHLRDGRLVGHAPSVRDLFSLAN